jgi:hypothetical protein
MRRRRPWLAALLSGIFPGLGQLYNAEPVRALAFVLAGIATMIGPFNPLAVEIDLDDPVAGLRRMLLVSLPFTLVALWSVADAYRRAKSATPRVDTPSLS